MSPPLNLVDHISRVQLRFSPPDTITRSSVALHPPEALAMMGFPHGGRCLSSRVIQKETRLLVFDFFKTTEEENLLSVIAKRLKKASHTKKTWRYVVHSKIIFLLLLIFYI